MKILQLGQKLASSVVYRLSSIVAQMMEKATLLYIVLANNQENSLIKTQNAAKTTSNENSHQMHSLWNKLGQRCLQWLKLK